LPAATSTNLGISAEVSPAQRGLWLIDKLYPESSVYNIFCPVRLTGPLDLPALEAAIAAVVARHEALRTSFPDRDGQPGTEVADHLDVPLPVTDLSGLPEAERAAAVAQYIQQWCEQPFDLATGPLLRAVVVKTGRQEHVL
jgi:hypothetical protein